MTQARYPSENVRSRTLLILRIGLWLVWGVMLFGSFMFANVIALIFSNPSTETLPDAHNIAVLFFVAMTGGVCSVSFFHALRYIVFRLVLRRRSWVGFAITYPIGKVVTWAACNGVVYFSLVVCLIARSFLPALPLAIGAWFLIAIDPPLFRPFRNLEPAAGKSPNPAA